MEDMWVWFPVVPPLLKHATIVIYVAIVVLPIVSNDLYCYSTAKCD